MRAEYDAFAKEIAEMLKQADIAVSVVDTPGADDVDEDGDGTSPRGGRVIALAAAAVVAVAALGWFLLR